MSRCGSNQIVRFEVVPLNLGEWRSSKHGWKGRKPLLKDSTRFYSGETANDIPLKCRSTDHTDH
jgi:hypothetical protein